MKDKNAIPQHIAIVMDGNGRWAKKRLLPRSVGHRAGVKVVEKLPDFFFEKGVRYLTLFCFSSENWQRPKSEVDALFSLLEEYLQKEAKAFREKGFNLSFLGRTDRLPEKIQKLMREIEESNLPASQEKARLILAVSYGGQEELVDASKKLASKVLKGEMSVDDIDENAFANALYMPNIPPPDLVIRTSGEKRISNFLLWQSAYSEFVFLDTLWPDCSEKDFSQALEEYAFRQRRFGQI